MFFLKKLFQTYSDFSTRNFSFFIAFLISLIGLRIFEFYTVEFVGEDIQKYSHLFLGFLIDIQIAFLIYFISISIQFILRLLFLKKQFIFPILASIFILLNYSLIVFFQKAKLPLDESIFLFSLKEVKMIGNLGQNASFYSILLGVLFFIMYFMFYFLSKKIILKENFKKSLILAQFLSIILVRFIYFENDLKTETVFVNNRLVYFGKRTQIYLQAQNEVQLLEANYNLNSFKNINPNFFAAFDKHNEYPLMHPLLQKSEFAKNLNITKKLPNIVIIIVESLSSDFVGKNALKTGNPMPFLDSLSSKSLYFPHFLSTCQRTFNVLPASLASIPNSTDGNFTTNTEFVPQLSLPLLLKEKYFTRFYCGVDMNYSNMGSYIKNLNTKYLVQNWDKKYQIKFSKRPNYWGFPDNYLFEKSWEDYEKQELNSKPRLDVFLTISAHDPYAFPEDEKYAKKTKIKSNKLKIDKETRKLLYENEFVMASYTFTDDVLKKYFQQAKKQSDFENTIFFIYGDHSCPYYAPNQLSKYCVPLIIYSPLIKKAKQIESISTHLDITPTIINMLATNYQFKTTKDVSFVGGELDFNETFRSTKSLPFLSYKGVNEAILDKNYFYSDGKLFKLQKNLSLLEIENNTKSKYLKKQLEIYENFSKYCFSKQKIIPVEKFKILNDNKIVIDQINYNYLFSEIIDFSNKKVKENKIELTENFTLNQKTKKVKVVSEFDWYLEKEFDLDSIPRVVFSIHDEQGKKIIWNIARPKFTQKFKTNSYNKLRLLMEVDLKDIKQLPKKNTVKFYLYNKKNKSWKIKKVKSMFYSV